jgi:hypothetical protein
LHVVLFVSPHSAFEFLIPILGRFSGEAKEQVISALSAKPACRKLEIRPESCQVDSFVWKGIEKEKEYL